MELKALGIKEVNRPTVGRLLKDIGYSLKVNHKKKASGANKTREARAQRNQQFQYINRLCPQFANEGNLIISIDSKKKGSHIVVVVNEIQWIDFQRIE